MSVSYREATAVDVPAIIRGRLADASAEPPDERMAAYLAGTHHPQQALAPRVAFIAMLDERVVGYTAGHLSRRYGCDGELQYLFVTSDLRRHGIATALVEQLARWFVARGAFRICVNVNAESDAAEPFYARCGAEPLRPHWYVWQDIRSVIAEA
jgi:GNAT superfamily N-acetyltransferase